MPTLISGVHHTDVGQSAGNTLQANESIFILVEQEKRRTEANAQVILVGKKRGRILVHGVDVLSEKYI